MSNIGEYDELRCPRCGNMNRRFHTFALRTRIAYRNQCDYCLADLTTGKMRWYGWWDRLVTVGGYWLFGGLIGVFVAGISVAFTVPDAGPGLMMKRIIIAIGGVVGVVLSEKSRRRSRRTQADLPDKPEGVDVKGRQSATLSDRALPSSPSGGDDKTAPQTHAAVRAKAARQAYATYGLFIGMAGSVFVNWSWKQLGLAPINEGAVYTLMAAGGAVAGYLWGRFRNLRRPADMDRTSK